jgi:hypothetical protein
MNDLQYPNSFGGSQFWDALPTLFAFGGVGAGCINNCYIWHPFDNTGTNYSPKSLKVRVF